MSFDSERIEQECTGHEKIMLRRVDDYHNFFNTESGERVLLDLIENGFLFKPTHVSNDKCASDKNEGKRELLLYIISNLQFSVKELFNKINLIREQQRKNYDL